MMKGFLLGGALVALAAPAVAGPSKGKHKPAVPARIKCAVMTSMYVNVKQATKAKMYADYKGGRYFFCCLACPRMFKGSPARYASNPHIAVPTRKAHGHS